MKEERYFFCPDATAKDELPEEEARHASKALRLGRGDEIVLIDGKGWFHKARVAEINPRVCRYEIYKSEKRRPAWKGRAHLAVAPTKNAERTEWLAEKAVEIGIDELSFLDCRFSERHTLRLDRIERIAISAVKQSRKAFLPKINGMMPFGKFVRERGRDGARYIAHCLGCDTDCGGNGSRAAVPNGRLNLPAAMESGDITVLIGPEGDFSEEEVRLALSEGFVAASLGSSRLRTETAALYAVMLMNLKNSLHEDGGRACPLF